MLKRGFSLFEMLLSLALTALIMLSITAFYPRFYFAVIQQYQRYRLEEATQQALSGLIKDLRRAGFIASSVNHRLQSALEINTAGNCIIIRYDTTSSGEWRYHPYDPQRSDVFAYRYHNDNLESQTGITHCTGSASRWDKLFDPNEIAVKQFIAKQFVNYTELNITVQLKRDPAMTYTTNYYVKNQNQ